MTTKEYIDAVIEEYMDGRISSYQMVACLRKIQKSISENAVVAQ